MTEHCAVWNDDLWEQNHECCKARVRRLEVQNAEMQHAIGRLVGVVKSLHDAIYDFSDVVPDDQPYHHDNDGDERNLECTMRDTAFEVESVMIALGLTWADAIQDNGEGGNGGQEN
jgi:hypothetical protein